MSAAQITGVHLLAILKSGSELSTELRQQEDTVVCEVSWPKEYDDTFLEIAKRFRHHTDARRSVGVTRCVVIQLPSDVANIRQSEAWFRKQFGGSAELLPPTWILRTPSGAEITIRQTRDERILVIESATKEGWQGDEQALIDFLETLNRSHLCEPGTAEYVHPGNVEVTLSTAGLRLGKVRSIIQLAGLYR